MSWFRKKPVPRVNQTVHMEFSNGTVNGSFKQTYKAVEKVELFLTVKCGSGNAVALVHKLTFLNGDIMYFHDVPERKLLNCKAESNDGI